MSLTVRKGGTKCWTCETPVERIDACKQIVADGQMGKIDGYAIDLFSASAVVKVYDNCNDASRMKLDKLPLPRLVRVCYQVIGAT